MLHLLQEFRDSIAAARRLIAAAHVTDATGSFIWPEQDRQTVSEASFLKVFIAWESLQEKAFIEYLVGTASGAGNTVRCHATPLDRTHANQMLVGIMKFVDWSTPDVVRKLSRNFFVGGEPFEGTLAGIHSDLLDLKTIRNAAAHLASSTAQQLDALASRKLQRSVSGISAASFLLSVDPTSTAGDTILEVYVALLDAAAYRIVNA